MNATRRERWRQRFKDNALLACEIGAASLVLIILWYEGLITRKER